MCKYIVTGYESRIRRRIKLRWVKNLQKKSREDMAVEIKSGSTMVSMIVAGLTKITVHNL